MTLEYGDNLPSNLYQYIDFIIEKENNITITSSDIDSFDEMLDVGEYDIDYNFYFLTKTLHVTVKDTTVPDITIVDNPEIFENETFNVEEFINVSDLSNYTIDLIDSNVNYNKAGKYEAYINVIDEYGNANSATLPITINELTLTLSKNTLTLFINEDEQLDIQTNCDYPITYASSNENIATIDSTGKIKAIDAGNTTITVCVGNKTAICNVIVKELTLSLSKSSLTLLTSESAKITAKTNSNEKVSYKSSDEKIATIDNSGNIKAIAKGETTITASVGDKTATCKIIVNDLTLSISQNNLNLLTNESATLSIETNSSKKITYQSSNEKIATVDKSGNVKALSEGKTTISASVGNKQVTCNVTVKNTSLILSNSSLTLYVGDCRTLSAETNSSKTITYTSSNTNVATVDSSGKIKALSKGTTTINACVADKTAECEVTVKDITLSLSDSSLTLYVGHGKTLSAKTNSSEEVAYKSSNEKVATVDSSGYIVGKTQGTATITVSVENQTATCKVTVKSQSSSTDNTSYTVYITEHGKCYHSSGCRYLSQSKIAISKDKAIAQGYSACSVCKP